MSQINYAAMTDQEVKEYFLAHRDDEAAFHAYMDRINARPKKPGIKLDDPDWEEKMRDMVDQKIAEGKSSN
jgi:hypothetical protein